MEQNAWRAEAVVFDLDGTLADTFALVIASWNAAVREALGRVYSDEEVIARFGPTEMQMLRREVPAEMFPACAAQFLEHYEREHARVARVFEGVPELLERLRADDMPMGIMTGKGRDTADITLAALGWTELFAAVVTGDECGRPKPLPDGPLMVARQLGVQPKACAFVGDSPADMRAGKAAGMKTIYAAWHPVYADEVRKIGPDYVAKTPADVVQLLGLIP
jgi:pyrophosphatase PpaX